MERKKRPLVWSHSLTVKITAEMFRTIRGMSEGGDRRKMASTTRKLLELGIRQAERNQARREARRASNGEGASDGTEPASHVGASVLADAE